VSGFLLLLLQVMMGFIKEWQDKLGVKIVCSQVSSSSASTAALQQHSDRIHAASATQQPHCQRRCIG
jgi:hypothetical protein